MRFKCLTTIIAFNSIIRKVVSTINFKVNFLNIEMYVL